MRIFNDPLEMVKEVERDLFEMGRRVASHTMQDKNVEGDESYATMELFAYGYTLTRSDQDGLDAMLKYLGGNKEWVEADFHERIAPDYRNPGNAWRLREDTWKPFIRDGQFSYTYNERIRTQLYQVVRELTLRPNSRQAIITIYDAGKDQGNWGGKDRVPCSMHYQFAKRDGKLDCVYVMRSCDFLTHFPYDVYMAAKLNQHIASQIGCAAGHLTHFVGSLHAYRKDLAARGIF